MKKAHSPGYGACPTMSSQAQPTNKPMRQRMPQVTAWIDDLRDAFGTEAIEHAIKRGMAGEPNQFFAKEGGEQLGTAFDQESK